MPSISAEVIARALGGKRSGAQWLARCPAHDDSTPSLVLRDLGNGRVLVHCHAGCEQAAVIAALNKRGLWSLVGEALHAARYDTAPSANSYRPDEKARTVAALKIWVQAAPANGTLVEAYLRSRAITIAPPATLKYHSRLSHVDGATYPAMVGLVTTGASNTPIGIHRTFLAADCVAKAAVTPNKMMLGPCRGGAVRLAPAGDPLMIGEGIETCLAAMQATGYGAWAALSTSGLRTLDLPPAVQDVIVLADGDAPGEAAALAAAARCRHEGRRVRIARPPQGADFNDLLLDRSTSSGERRR